MPRAGPAARTEILAFCIDPSVKREVRKIVRTQHKPVGELLHELVEERVDRKRRLAFDAEARRQSLVIAAAARDPNSDEAAVMRELGANFEEFAREWK